MKKYTKKKSKKKSPKKKSPKKRSPKRKSPIKKKSPITKSPVRKNPIRKNPVKKNQKRQGIYCGNNKNNFSILSGEKIIGNRYQCMKNGFGVGYNLPLDEESKNDYLQDYEPVDDRKIWCGINPNLPPEYSFIGTNFMCFQKGFGAGRRKKALGL
jgi:hypothetical protein